MIEVEDLTESEITEVLSRVVYGHLACCRDDRPYVVPVHYAFEKGQHFYLHNRREKV